MKKLHLVYDFSDQLPSWTFFFPLLFIALGIGITLFHKNYVDPRATTTGINKRRFGIRFGIVFASFACLIFLISIPTELSDYFQMRTISKNRQYSNVEGKVENYHPMPASGHDMEKFDVSGVHFEFSDYMIINGYNNAASKGGVIKEGLLVKIGYYFSTKDDTNIILKLETE